MLELSHMDKLEHYLLNHLPHHSDAFMELEKFAKTHQVPIMDPVSINFLTQLVRIHQPQTILEIGTAIGYSALRMLDANPNAVVTTIEKNADMYDLALKNIKTHQKESSISVEHGDAIDILEQLKVDKKQFDFIFVDAAKGQYKRYFETVQSLTTERTIIVCDNVLFKGYVVDEAKVESKRIRSLVKKIQTFNAWLMEHPDFHTSIIPIGDGVSISVKK